MDLGTIIALNLKELRTQRNLTLGQLSKLSGISKAMLSDLEKGGCNPTINTLWKLAKGLNVPYTRLMEGIEEEATVVRKDARTMLHSESKAYRVYCCFQSTPVRNFELFYAELDPHSSNTTTPGHPARSQEYVYIIQGELTLDTALGRFTLSQGDTLMFDAARPHTYVNEQDTLLSFLVINHYPD